MEALANLKSYGESTYNKVIDSVNRINQGCKFNNVFYKDRYGCLNIYLDGDLVSLYRTKNKEHIIELEEIVKALIARNIVTILSDFHKMCEGED